MRTRGVWCTLACIACVGPAELWGQIDAPHGDGSVPAGPLRVHGTWPVGLGLGLGPVAGAPSTLDALASATQSQGDRTVSVAGAALSSFALPGLGQRRLGQERGWAYLAVEALAWGLYVDRRRAGARVRDQYRDLAWDVARIQVGRRQDGSFPYYETLSHWVRSGAFDADPGAVGVQPETDPSTFNGAVWSLSSGIYLPPGESVPEDDPRYRRAIEHYSARAAGEAFLWDWTGAEDVQGQFAVLIRRSDDRFRQATNVVGVIVFNHLVSGVDAYLSARGRTSPLTVGAAPGPRAASIRWSALLRVRGPV